MTSSVPLHRLTIWRGAESIVLDVPHGANLRHVLLAAGISPYGTLSRIANCGGRGLCATCGVWILAGEATPVQWHDRIGSRFGYPRLSCQITVISDLAIEILTEKTMWGAPRKSDRPHRG